MADTLIESVKEYIEGYTQLPAGAPIWVSYLGEVPGQYSVVPLPGARVISKYLGGGGEYEFPFAFQAMVSTADDYNRLATSGFFEQFAEWLESESEADNLPPLPAGKTPYEIQAVGWGSPIEQGQSDTGIYQIQCRLVYEQEP